MQPVLWAAGGTGFTCLMTALGASMVFFFRKRVSAGAQRIFLGFAAGVRGLKPTDPERTLTAPVPLSVFR